MPAPTSSLATLRPDLAGSFFEFDVMMQQRGYIATQVLPVFEAAKASGTFGLVPIEQLLQTQTTTRAPGSGYGRGNWTFTTDTFATVEHGWEEPVDDNEAAMYSEFFDAEQVSAFRAMNIVMENAEQRAADLVFNTTTFPVTAVGTEWSTATATPIVDVEAAVVRHYDQSGIWPDTMVITQKVFRNLRLVTEVKDAIASAGAGDPNKLSDITLAMLRSVFDLPKIFVGGTSKNTANEGQSATIAPIWDDEYCWIGKTADTNDIREPCVGRTIHWSEDGSQIGGTVETYRDETVRSDIVRVRHQVDEKLLYDQMGELLSNITA